jgi:serine/threonine protein kinase
MSSEARTTLAGRYVLESRIATGGMGRVWKARDEVLARPVAIKIMHEHLSEDDAFVARFKREAMAAARLTHPHIVAIYDTGAETMADGTERHYIVMEHCGGGTLAARKSGGPMPPDRVVVIGQTICEALDYAHRNGVVHRDIKPENVLITEDGSLKVGDFGIAKAAFATGDITSTGSLLGTVAYISPEQAQGREPDARSDIYALGVLLYELVTGRPPFAAETQIATAMQHVREAPRSPRSIRADVPRPLEAAILRTLEKDPDRRFSSAGELASALENAGRGRETAVLPPVASPGEPSARAETTSVPAQSPELKWVAPVLAVAAAVILLALVVPQFFAPDEDLPGPNQNGSGSGNEIDVQRVEDFDPPPGDGTEHSDEINLAIDGDPSTAWTTENYSDPFGVLKPGVGLLLDLGPNAEVGRIRIAGEPGTVEVRSGDRAPTSPEDLDIVEEISISGTDDIALDEASTARYWLVWITSLPDETGSASISEVTFYAP